MNNYSERDQIKTGDLFSINGNVHECIGTDYGAIWYLDPRHFDATPANREDCKKLSESDLRTLNNY